jgi:hypothetical protein
MSKFSGSGCRIRGVWSLFYAASTARLTCPSRALGSLSFAGTQSTRKGTRSKLLLFILNHLADPQGQLKSHRSWQTLPSCALTAVRDVQVLAVSSHPLPLSNLFLNALLHRCIPLSRSSLLLSISLSPSLFLFLSHAHAHDHRHTRTHAHTHTHTYTHCNKRSLRKLQTVVQTATDGFGPGSGLRNGRKPSVIGARFGSHKL